MSDGHYDQHGRYLPKLKTVEELKTVPFEMYARVLARAEKAEANWAKDCASWCEDIARAERAEAEADSLRNIIDNMRVMNIKITLEAAGKVLAAEAERDAGREE
jgi:hypothetical protein